MKRNYKAIIGFAGLLFALESTGYGDTLISEGPQIQTSAGIPHLSGGIGLDEREALRFLAKEYNLQLSFALKKGNYLSDIEVLIADDRGTTVLAAVSQGPWFFTKLPAGTYRIRAKTLGNLLSKWLMCPNKGRPGSPSCGKTDPSNLCKPTAKTAPWTSSASLA